MMTKTTVCPRWPALVVPASTACVPWYSPHSRVPKVAVIMKATSSARTRLRLRAVSKASSVLRSKRAVSRASCT